MKATPSQYFTDIKPKLLTLGYTTCDPVSTEKDMVLINDINGLNAKVHFIIPEEYKYDFGRYHIEKYNPRLFLALVAMTTSEMPRFGEYLTLVGSNSGNLYTIDGLGKVSIMVDDHNKHLLRPFEHSYNEGPGYGYLELNGSIYRKSYLKEIIDHFSN